MAHCYRPTCEHRDGACEKNPMPLCAECEDETAVGYFDRGADFAFWTNQPREIPVCADCKHHLENREPREVTFDEALGARCDEQQRMVEAQRLK